MRAFNINISTVMEGGSKEELDKIPIFRYKTHTVEQSPEQEQQGCAVSTPVEGETTKRSKYEASSWCDRTRTILSYRGFNNF